MDLLSKIVSLECDPEPHPLSVPNCCKVEKAVKASFHLANVNPRISRMIPN